MFTNQLYRNGIGIKMSPEMDFYRDDYAPDIFLPPYHHLSGCLWNQVCSSTKFAPSNRVISSLEGIFGGSNHTTGTETVCEALVDLFFQLKKQDH